MRPSRQFSPLRLASDRFSPDLLGQLPKARLRIWIAKGSLGNDRAKLFHWMPQNVKVIRLQQIDEVRPLDAGVTAREAHGNVVIGKAIGLVALQVSAPAVMLPGPDEQDPGKRGRVRNGY